MRADCVFPMQHGQTQLERIEDGHYVTIRVHGSDRKRDDEAERQYRFDI